MPLILRELEKIWNENPDLRLGQLIMMATRPKGTCPEVFYIEDEDMLKGIMAIGRKVEKPEDNKRIPYWELYPDIIKIKIEEISPELIVQFMEAARRENPNAIVTPRGMMKLTGAPIEDINWFDKEKELRN